MKRSSLSATRFFVTQFKDGIRAFGMDHITSIIYIPGKKIEVRFNGDAPFETTDGNAADELFVGFCYAMGNEKRETEAMVAVWKNNNAQ